MIRANYKGNTVEIKLPKESGYKGYSVECTYKYIKHEKKYLLSMWIKRNDISNKLRIQSQEIDTQYISGTKDTIVNNICRIVEQIFEKGFFKEYVDRYEYELLCFEKGDELLRGER